MRRESRRAIARAAGLVIAGLLGAVPAHGQDDPADRTPLAEEVFLNVQVMRGVPVDQFMGAMGLFSNALSANCTYCHVGDGGGGWEQYAEDVGPKETARRMVQMMNAINETYFGGRRVVTCVSCHNGANRPSVSMSMAEVYGTPPTDEPDGALRQIPGFPSAEEVLATYLEALGGAERLGGLTSITASGTHLGYGEAQATPLDIFAQAPGRRTTIVHGLGGDITTTYNDGVGWLAMPATDTPVPLRPLAGGDLDGARLDVDLSFPLQIRQAFDTWRGAFPASLEDRDVLVIQGARTGQLPVKLYFDAESGLLVRLVRYTDTPVGPNATQIDYADYREIAGVMMPFRWTVTWQSGQSTFELTDVQPNVAIDEARFARPAAPPR